MLNYTEGLFHFSLICLREINTKKSEVTHNLQTTLFFLMLLPHSRPKEHMVSNCDITLKPNMQANWADQENILESILMSSRMIVFLLE